MAVVNHSNRPPWLLSLIALPLGGVAAWFAWSLLVPDNPDALFHQPPLIAVPYLLAFAAPPLVTLAVSARRETRVALALGLAAGSLLLTWALIALAIGLVFAVGCSGSPDPCLS